MTAVEWLFEKLWDEPKDKFTWYALREKAIQMEKKQMKKSWRDGFSFQSPYKNFEQYYKEIYGKETNSNASIS